VFRKREKKGRLINKMPFARGKAVGQFFHVSLKKNRIKRKPSRNEEDDTCQNTSIIRIVFKKKRGGTV